MIGALEQWYYRISNRVALAAQVGAGPHGITVRATTTIPANKFGIIASARLSVVRQTAAAPAVNALTWIEVAGQIVWLVQLEATDNAAGNNEKINIAGGYVIAMPGEVVNLSTSDSSTGGTVNYRMWAIIELFDAA